jgi:glycine/D-amino acid oxidase-like deaminating enzyme
VTSARRVIVVGAGIYGSLAAWRLAELGAEVTLVERDGPGHPRGASGGLTRVLRVEYGAAARYTALTLAAIERWRSLERALATELYRELGVLFLVGDGDDDAWERASLETTSAAGVGGVALEPADVVRRWPAISPDGLVWALHNPQGGMLRARHATERVAAAAVAAGVTLRGRCRVAAVEDGTVTLADGTRLVADQVLLATGSWTSGLWEAAPIVATRQLTLYLDADPGPLPIFGEGAPFSHYGFPAHDGLGFKVGSHVTGAPGDPADEAARTALAAEVDGIRAYAARRFPATAGAPVRSADVCFYAMTPTADPVVDRLDDRTVVCAGFSGHGFKFAPVVAPAAAELVLGREPSVDVRPFAVPTTSRLSA